MRSIREAAIVATARTGMAKSFRGSFNLTRPDDMAAAVNSIRASQGGAVLCKNGEILAELPLPIFGIMSDLPIEDIARRLKQIRKTAAALGVPHPDPLLTLITLTGAAIPYLRICEEGLVNLKDGQTGPLIAT